VSKNEMFRLDKETGEVERLRDFEGNCVYSCRYGELYAISTSVGTFRREYDIAVAATAEYTAYFGNKTLAFAAITTVINRTNAVYEREFGVRLNLINNSDIIFTNAATDGYTNGSPSTMLSENQPILDGILGNAAYDIGHVFGTIGGGWSGIASLNSVCSSSRKGRAASTASAPDSDSFVQSLFVHELGHQFGSPHTFNASTSGNCSSGNRTGSNAYEPGSGSTIMSYAGSCGSQNIVSNNDDYFHAGSFERIVEHISDNTTPFPGFEGGDTCATHVNTSNPAPVVDAGSDYTIPKDTPFILDGTATDATVNGSLTYAWEQYEIGAAWTNAAVLPNTDDDAARPIFRSYTPASQTSRIFPTLSSILNKSYQNSGESLPIFPRTIPFKFTVRDNQGGVTNDTANITIDNSVGPFRLTAPAGSEIWAPNSQQTITWNVAGTNGGSVNCANVDILLSTDNGQTYPLTIATNTLNDGSHQVNMPNIAAMGAVLKIQCSNNIFFDASSINICTPLYFDTHEDGFSDWTAAQGSGSNPWVGKTNGGFSGSNYWNVPNSSAKLGADSYLTSNTINATTDDLFLQFQHNYHFQAFSNNNNDGGRVEISINGGSFQDIGSANFTQNGYTGIVNAASGSDLAGQDIFSGNSNGYIGSSADLNNINTNDTIRIRFRMATDYWYSGSDYDGWSVDDVLICSQATGPAPALTITKSAPSSVVTGDQLVYTLVVENNGTATADSVTLTDTLPSNTSFSSASDGGSLDSNTVSWNLGNIITGTMGTLTRTLTVSVNSGLSNGTLIGNTAQASASNLLLDVDSNTVNTTVTSPVFAVSLDPNPDPIEAETTLITYTLTVNNSGDATATNVLITNNIPSGTAYVANSASDGGSHSGGEVSWPATTIAPASSVVRTFQVSVTQPLVDGNSIGNNVNVQSAQGINVTNLGISEIVGGVKEIFLPLIMRN
ncbi:MAG: DUF11 domain-containing protein, partial [Chloroflexi bacterium]|nr:DUF11 domain-containing protein [Chloroflexota bacterium]